jgi:chromosome segregation ATPase
MGLTAEPKKVSIETYQVLLEIAAGLSELSSNPKALKNAIEESYALSEEEKARADKAREDIQNNRDILASIKNQNDANVKLLSQLSDKQKELSEQNKLLDAKKVELDRFSRELDKRNADCAAREDAATRRDADLSAEKTRLANKEAELKDRQSKIEAQEEDIKNRLNKLQAIAIGG